MYDLSFRCPRAWLVFGSMLALTVLNCFWIAQLEEAYWLRSALCLATGALLGLFASIAYVIWSDHAR